LIPRILKGSIKRAPINLKTISIEKPMILNGSKISQINGNKNKSAMATGQHKTNKMHQRIREIRVFIESFYT